MQTLIEAVDLKKYFDTPSGKLHAVDGVSFEIQQGKTLGVVGESGCGKSTLGRLLVRLLDPTAGHICYKGKNISEWRGKKLQKQRRLMQIIFQDPFSSLNPKMCVHELIAEPLCIHGLCKGKELNEKILEVMELVGLANRFQSAYPHELDGGRRQRVGIARSLILNPEFIVCDEPVSALDVSIQAQILNLMQDLQDSLNLSYLFITHDLSVVKHVSDEIIVMYLGVVVEQCKAKIIFDTGVHPYTKALLSAIPIPDIHVNNEPILLQGEVQSPIEPESACRFAPRCPYAQPICFSQAPVLKNIGDQHRVACHRISERGVVDWTE